MSLLKVVGFFFTSDSHTLDNYIGVLGSVVYTFDRKFPISIEVNVSIVNPRNSYTLHNQFHNKLITD